ncbi:MAG: hypothetical protein KJO69_02385 [Gammaproteobacteria bacterium]|nr:hypothetical protein [Gammaproteobacteria bacterium]
MNFDKIFEQFKALAEKHLGEPNEYQSHATQSDNADSSSPSDTDFENQSKDKVRSIIRDFQSITPYIEQAGYQITDLQIELGLIPKLIPHFLKVRQVDEVEKTAILEQIENKRLMKMLLRALFKADSFQQNLNMNQYAFKGIEVEIAPIPAVRLNYRHLHNSEDDSEKNSQDLTSST